MDPLKQLDQYYRNLFDLYHPDRIESAVIIKHMNQAKLSKWTMKLQTLPWYEYLYSPEYNQVWQQSSLEQLFQQFEEDVTTDLERWCLGCAIVQRKNEFHPNSIETYIQEYHTLQFLGYKERVDALSLTESKSDIINQPLPVIYRMIHTSNRLFDASDDSIVPFMQFAHKYWSATEIIEWSRCFKHVQKLRQHIWSNLDLELSEADQKWLIYLLSQKL